MNDNALISDTNRDAKLSVILAEYNSLRSEILSIERSIQELSLASLVSIAGLATLIITLLESSPDLLLALLVILPLPFSAMLMSYLGQINALSNIGHYIADYIEAEAHKLVTESQPQIFVWHTLQYYSKKYRGISGFIATGYWAVGQGLLIGFPILGAIFAAFYFSLGDTIITTTWHKIGLIVDVLIAIILFISSIITFYRFGYFRSD